MKRLIKNQSLDPAGRVIIAEYLIAMCGVLGNEPEIAASSDFGLDKFPGRAQFLSDIESILVNKFNCQIAESHESSSPEADSISVYITFYYPVSDDASVKCTVFMKVSDHHGIGIYTKEYRAFLEKLEQKYLHPTSTQLHDALILTDSKIFSDYHEALDQIELEIDSIFRGWKRDYIKKGAV